MSFYAKGAHSGMPNTITSIKTEQINDSFPEEFSNTFWNKFREDAAQKRVPIHGHFELTPRCNFNCKMCYVHLEPQQIHCAELSFDNWKEIIDDAINAGMVFASLSGGECLLVPYFNELYLYLKRRGILIFVLTNGFLLKEKLSLFSSHPPAHIQVSVYGWDNDSYENVTGQRAYHNVVEGILCARKMGLSVSVAITASRYLPSVYKIVEFFYKEGIGATVNKWLLPPNQSTGRSLDNFNLTPSEQADIEAEILQASNQKQYDPFQGSLPPTGSNNTIHHYGLTCAAGRTDFCINWKGEMCPCVSLYTPTGHPLKEGFKTAWEKTVQFADKFEQPIECFECQYKLMCKRCPAFHLLSGKSGHCNTNACEECKIMVSRGIVQPIFL